jgi:hypothetical protein
MVPTFALRDTAVMTIQLMVRDRMTISRTMSVCEMFMRELGPYQSMDISDVDCMRL